MDIVTCMPFKRQENLSPFIFMSVPSMALRLLSASHFISRLGKSSLSATAGVTSRFLVQGQTEMHIIAVWYICIAPCSRQQEPGVRYVAGELLRSTRMKQRGANFRGKIKYVRLYGTKESEGQTYTRRHSRWGVLSMHSVYATSVLN